MDSKRILIVEDDYIQRTLLKEVLTQGGFEVAAASDGMEALAWLQRSGLPHLVVMDLGLPGMHGFTLSERIKHMGDVPIIIITGDDSTTSQLYGIQQFAEDYITKPFDAQLVVARVRRVLSRITDFSFAQEPEVVIDARLRIDFPNNRLTRDGENVALTPIETNLLYILVSNKGRVITPETLMSRIWPGEEVFEETLRVHLHRLRRKLQPDADSPQYIRTERGVGYSFYVPDEHDSEPRPTRL